MLDSDAQMIRPRGILMFHRVLNAADVIGVRIGLVVREPEANAGGSAAEGGAEATGGRQAAEGGVEVKGAPEAADKGAKADGRKVAELGARATGGAEAEAVDAEGGEQATGAEAEAEAVDAEVGEESGA